MTPNDPGWIFRPITFVERVKPLHDRLVTRPYHVICRRRSVFRKIIFLTPVTPNDPGWVFRPISFVAIHPYLLLTKFGKNPIKHVEEEADCEKERRKKKELDMCPLPRARVKLGGQTRSPRFWCKKPFWPLWSKIQIWANKFWRGVNLMHMHELH